MIPKGNQRGGGQQLAAHLMNSFDNDRVELANVRGSVAQDLSGAFAEWQAEANATKCRKYLYSLSLNPDQRQGRLTREQYLDFIDRAEKRLGLENQPRAIVFHVKHGREHAHVVWSRIDTEKMRAVQMSNDHQKLRKVAQEFARDHGIELPDGLKNNKGAERYEDRKDQAVLREMQQEERSGFSKAGRVRSITDAWNTTRTGEDFIRALAAKDYYLARGDRRGYVVVDLAGEIHSLSRQIKGAKGRDITARLSSVPPDKLPTAEKAQAYARQVRDFRTQEKDRANQTKDRNTLTPDERRDQLRRQHAARRAALDGERDKLTLRQAKEKGQLALLQASENAGIVAARLEKKPSGITAFLMRITGIKLMVDLRQRAQDKSRARQHDEQAKSLDRRQDRERQESDRLYAAMERVEGRELRSLETALRREEFQKATGRGEGRPPEKEGPILAPPQPERIAQRQSGPPRGPIGKQPDKKTLTGSFTRAAQGIRKSEPVPDKAEPEKTGTLREAFARAGLTPETTPEATPQPETQPTPETTTTQTQAQTGSLAEEFRRRAEQKDRRQRDGLDTGREKHYRSLPVDYTTRR
jgi:hypothetical protein